MHLMAYYVTNEELHCFIVEHFEKHLFTDNALIACACCGVREFQPVAGLSEKKRFKTVKLCDLDADQQEPLRYTKDENKAFEKLVRAGEVRVLNEEEDDFVSIQPWKVISQHKKGRVRFHLHPELVDFDENNEEVIRMCPTCFNCVVDKCIRPKLSIANGVDFGWVSRIPEITLPNLHEQILLAQVRLFQTIIKVRSNSSFQKNFTRNNIQGNAILFAHDAPQKVADLMSNVDHLRKLLSFVLLMRQRRLIDLQSTLFVHPASWQEPM